LIHSAISFKDAVSLDGFVSGYDQRRTSNETTHENVNQTTNYIATLTPDAKSITSYQATQLSTCNFYVGPVGDFTPEEIQLALEHNFCAISLGSQILRTETAAIVAATLICQDLN
jgi:16S rRNA (uracil1498-N3)-methyltransferase